MSTKRTNNETALPPLKGITDEENTQLRHDLQRYQRTSKKKQLAQNPFIVSAILCLMLIGVSIINSEVRISVLYPTIAYLLFQIIDKVIERFGLSVPE